MDQVLRAKVLFNVLDRAIQLHGAWLLDRSAPGVDVRMARALRIADGATRSTRLPSPRGTQRGDGDSGWPTEHVRPTATRLSQFAHSLNSIRRTCDANALERSKGTTSVTGASPPANCRWHRPCGCRPGWSSRSRVPAAFDFQLIAAGGSESTYRVTDAAVVRSPCGDTRSRAASPPP